MTVQGPPPSAEGTSPPQDGSDSFRVWLALGYGWVKLTRNWWQFLLAEVLFTAVFLGLFYFRSLFTGENPTPSGLAPDVEGSLQFAVSNWLSYTATTFFGILATATLIRGSVDVVEGESFGIGRAFTRLPFIHTIVTSLVLSVLIGIGFVLGSIPGLLVLVSLSFTMYFVVDKKHNAFEAIKSSSGLVKANFGKTTRLGLASFGILFLSLLTFGVGLIVGLPVILFAWAYAYKALLGEPVAP